MYPQLGLVFKSGDPIPETFEFLPTTGPRPSIFETAGSFIKDIFGRPAPAPTPTAPQPRIIRTGFDPKTIEELRAAARTIAARKAQPPRPPVSQGYYEPQPRRRVAQAGMFGNGDWMVPLGIGVVALIAFTQMR